MAYGAHKADSLFGDTVRLRDVDKKKLFSIEVSMRGAQSCVGTRTVVAATIRVG